MNKISLKSIILVSFQMVTMAYFLITTNPIGNGFGLVIQVLGFVIAIWGMLTMRFGNFNIQPEVKSSTLITKGPYKVIRNPMYTGLFLIFFPMVFNDFNLINLLVFNALMITLILKIFSEEQFLVQCFGVEYLNYKKRTFRLFPYIF